MLPCGLFAIGATVLPRTQRRVVVRAPSAGGLPRLLLTVREGKYGAACRILGINDYGQIMAPAGTFKTVAAGDTFKTVAVGRFHTCWVRTSGEATCFGDNDTGEASPVAGTFAAVAAGRSHTCAIRMDGSIVCWGAPDERTTAPSGTFQLGKN